MKAEIVVLGSDALACEAALEARARGLEVVLVPASAAAFAADAARAVRWRLREAALHLLRAQTLYAGTPPTLRYGTVDDTELATFFRDSFERHRGGLRDRLARAGVHVLPGPGRLAPDRSVATGSGDRIEAPCVLVAAGAFPRRPACFRFDGQLICDFVQLFAAPGLPRTLAVLGASEIGCEIACVFALLGTRVTLLDRRERSLRYVDAELREALHARMHAMGVEIVLGEGLSRIGVASGDERHVAVELASGRRELVDRVAIDAGLQPATADLGLGAVGIEMDPSGFVLTDPYQQTSLPGVYAVGGATSQIGGLLQPLQQARLAVLHGLGETPPDPPEMPIVVRTLPDLAMVGLTAEMCRQLDVEHRVGIARHDDVTGLGEPALLKLVVGPNGALIGIQIAGPAAGDLIHVGAGLLARGATVQELANNNFGIADMARLYVHAARNLAA